MSLAVTKSNCTLTIVWPSSCCVGLNLDALKFIVVVDDVENYFRMVTIPLSAESLILGVAIPPYFSSSAYQLVVTVHLCQALISETGWKTLESLSTDAVSSDDEFAWQYSCEHGPTGRLHTVQVQS